MEESRASIIEQIFVAAAILSIVVLPPIYWELFPLSTCSMFAHPYQQFRTYSLYDATNQKLNNDLYGLRSNANWYLEYTYPVKYPKNVVSPPDLAVDVFVLAEHVRHVAESAGAMFPLRLEIKQLGDIDNSTVGIVLEEKWEVARDGNVAQIPVD